MCNQSLCAQTYEEYVEAGVKAASINAYAEAEECSRRALQKSPDDYRNALLYSNLAKVQEAQGHKLKAIDSYDLALAIAPLNIPILQSRANLYFELGNYKKALIDYGKILDKNPRNIEALQGSGYIYQQLKDYEKA